MSDFEYGLRRGCVVCGSNEVVAAVPAAAPVHANASVR